MTYDMRFVPLGPLAGGRGIYCNPCTECEVGYFLEKGVAE
jgi:hypothetical protein